MAVSSRGTVGQYVLLWLTACIVGTVVVWWSTRTDPFEKGFLQVRGIVRAIGVDGRPGQVRVEIVVEGRRSEVVSYVYSPNRPSDELSVGDTVTVAYPPGKTEYAIAGIPDNLGKPVSWLWASLWGSLVPTILGILVLVLVRSPAWGSGGRNHG